MRQCAAVLGLNDGGISGAICRAFVERGVHVVAVSRKASRSNLATHPLVTAIDADFEDDRWCDRALAPFAERNIGIDFFVHCAAANFPKTGIGATSMTSVTSEFQIGLFSAMEFLVHADERLSSDARLLLFGSNAALRGAKRRAFHYCSMKAALNGFVAGAAAEYARRGIAINALAPSQTLTERVSAHGRISRDEIKARMKSYSPFGRAAEPDEVAAFALGLLFAETPYFTGQVIAFDGGTALNWEPEPA